MIICGAFGYFFIWEYDSVSYVTDLKPGMVVVFTGVLQVLLNFGYKEHYPAYFPHSSKDTSTLESRQRIDSDRCLALFLTIEPHKSVHREHLKLPKWRFKIIL